MKLIKSSESGIVVELTNIEVGTLAEAVVEFTQGAYSPNDKEWSDLGLGNRIECLELVEKLMSYTKS